MQNSDLKGSDLQNGLSGFFVLYICQHELYLLKPLGQSSELWTLSSIVLSRNVGRFLVGVCFHDNGRVSTIVKLHWISKIIRKMIPWRKNNSQASSHGGYKPALANNDLHSLMHHSVQPVPIPPGNPGEFFQVLSVPGVGHLCTPVTPWEFDAHAFKTVISPGRVLFLRDGEKRYGFRVTVACPRRID